MDVATVPSPELTPWGICSDSEVIAIFVLRRSTRLLVRQGTKLGTANEDLWHHLPCPCLASYAGINAPRPSRPLEVKCVLRNDVLLILGLLRRCANQCAPLRRPKPIICSFAGVSIRPALLSFPGGAL
ncbi:unnamed protein product [Nezara viridula]|uniref:Uncharacterized protein n=1 Tax=Nezara viridula TaxID=85310 RepID=A0A9P0EF94_NEZVI|nr:unnamed protein product [Nezara viridula]